MLAVILLIGVSQVSCSKSPAVDNRFNLLFRTTDHFVEMLDSTYEHNDPFGKKAEDRSDGNITGNFILID